MRDFVVLAIVFGALPFILRRPDVGILVWSWIGYMNPHRLSWGVARELPLAAITAGALLLGLLLSRETKRIPMTSLTIVWLSFVLWVCMTTLFAFAPDLASEQLKKVLKIQLVAFITVMLMNSKERLNALIIVIVFSLGFYGVKGGIFTILTGGNHKIWGPDDTFIGGNNEIGLALIMTFPFMYYLRSISSNAWIRFSMLVAMGFTALTIVATYSRGAFLAASVMAIYLALKSNKRILAGMTLIILAPIIFAFMPEQWHGRIATIQHYDQDQSANERINSWWFAFNLAKANPFLGGGFEAFRPELFAKYAPHPEIVFDAHSIYFEVLAEHGFVGLGLFLTLGWLTLRSASWIVRTTKNSADLKWHHDLAAMTQVSLVGYAVGGLFLGLAYFDLYYHLIGITVLNRYILENKLHGGGTPKLLDRIRYPSLYKKRLGLRGDTLAKHWVELRIANATTHSTEADYPRVI